MFSYDGKLMESLTWITRLLYLQLLWIGFSLVGLIVGGLFPATFTLFGVCRKLMRDNPDIPLFKTFLEMFKQSFLKANILGYVMFLFAYSLYFYYVWFSQVPGTFATIGLVVLGIITFLFIAVALFVMPVYAHFDVDLIGVIKHAALTAISHPFYVLFMMLVLIASWFLFAFLPVLFFFIGTSTAVYVLMFIANMAFNNIERRLKEKQGER